VDLSTRLRGINCNVCGVYSPEPHVELDRLQLNFKMVATRMDTPKYGETLKFMYIKYQPILVVLPKVYEVSLWCNQHNL